MVMSVVIVNALMKSKLLMNIMNMIVFVILKKIIIKSAIL